MTILAYADVDSHFCPGCAVAQDGDDPGTLALLTPVTDAATLPEGAACYTCSRPLRGPRLETAIADVRAVVARIAGADFAERVGEPDPDDGLPF